MTTKELLLQKIESMSESEITEMFNYAQIISQKYNHNQLEAKPPHRQGTGNILRHAGKWVGDDLKDCLEMVSASRGSAKF